MPVFKINAEYDAALLEAPVRRPDDAKLVDWDVVGTSHNDDAALRFRRALERRDLGNAPEDTLVCDHPIGTKTVIGDAMISGLDKLVGWAHGGPPLPSAPPLQFQSGPPGPLARDAYGIALGGLRLPSIQAPIATSNGINTGGGTCDRWGYTEPFSAATLSALYPDHATYVAKVTAAAQASLAAGYIEQDAADPHHPGGQGLADRHGLHRGHRRRHRQRAGHPLADARHPGLVRVVHARGDPGVHGVDHGQRDLFCR